MPNLMLAWQQLSFKHLLYLTFWCSLALSLAELATGRPIDPDSITFINAAHAYGKFGWHAALQTYPWPFFPIAGLVLSRLSHLPIAVTFHIINTLAQALLCISFVLLSRQLGASLRTQKVAALVILLYPFLNSIRVYATRESGYWALALIAVVFLLRFMSRHRQRDALAFGVAMSLAFLFRVEALLMLITVPLAIFLMPAHRWRYKWQLYWRANVVLFILILIAVAYHALGFDHTVTNVHEKTSRLQEYYLQLHQLLPQLSQQIRLDAQQMGQLILSPDAQPTQTLLLSGGLVMLCLVIIIKVMQPLLVVLAVYSQVQRLMPNNYGQATLLGWLLVVNFLMLLLFTFERYFLATRYPVFLTLIGLAWVPFALTRLYDQYHNKAPQLSGRHWFFPSLMCLLILTALGGVVRFGYSKAYITQAGQWLYQTLPANAKLYSNSREVAFYAANGNADPQRLEHQDLRVLSDALEHPCRYDWLAIRLNRDDPQETVTRHFLAQNIPHKIFMNKRRDAVNIYTKPLNCAPYEQK